VKIGPAEPLYRTEHFFVEAGAVGRSPFTIKKQDKNFYLDDSGTADVQAYVQFRLRKRDAWDKARELVGPAPRNWFGPCRKADSKWDCSMLWHPDFDVRVGFNFGQSSDASATTVAGTGDLNVSGAVGLPLLQVDNGNTIHTLNLEGIFEGVTDRGAQDIHFREGLGIAWAMGWVNRPLDIAGSGSALQDRVYELSLRPTANILESPNLDDSAPPISVNGVDKPVVKTRPSTQKPDFETRYGAFGVDLDFLIPYGERGYLTLGASLFGGNVNPDPWSVRLGTTIPLEQIVGVFVSPVTKQ
jgi:hypothetical protein